MLESVYQSRLIKKLRHRFPGCIILKNDSGLIQGIPDLCVLYGSCWAFLEVKPSKESPAQPNQEYYVERADEMSFGAFIYPENEQDVLDALQHAFNSPRAARLSER